MLKTDVIEIQDGDTLLTFEVKQMSAFQLERWVTRAVMLLARHGLEIPDGMGLEALGRMVQENGQSVLVKALTNLSYEEAQPLLDEMLACCWRTNAGIRQQVNAASAEGFISDFRTLLKLRAAALKINLGFLAEGGTASSDDPSITPVGVSIPAPRKKPRG